MKFLTFFVVSRRESGSGLEKGKRYTDEILFWVFGIRYLFRLKLKEIEEFWG